MYRIGQFSRFTRITIKALRFYEEERLITPNWTDPVTGYRYYTTDQLPRAHKIMSLRQCGFSIPQIRNILAGKNIATYFEERKKELEKEVQESSRQLSSIINYMESLGKDPTSVYEVVIKELPQVLVYSKRMIVESYNSYFTVIPKIGEEIAAANPDLVCVTDPPYCFIIYHDGEYRDHDIDMEFCEAVTDWGIAPPGIVFKIMNHVPRAACILHRGSYNRLPYAYTAACKWIEDNGYLIADNPRESYIDGIWNKPNEDDWLTELQIPLVSNS